MKERLRVYTREISVAVTIFVLMLVLALSAPGYFSRANLTDLFMANMPVMIVSLGMTLIILTGEIDISVGSMFAICSVVTGIAARWGLPGMGSGLAACLVGAACGAFNGALVGYLCIPSIVVTLATMVALRDGLRWQTQGSWIGNLPAHFQWLGLTQTTYTLSAFVLVCLLILLVATGLRYLHIGRAIFATGSNQAAARIIGIQTKRIIFFVFTLTGALTGLAAMLNSVRFNQVPSNSGLGLEMEVIAAVAVGGADITGGSGTILGTVLGVILLGSIGSALTFLGVSAYWGKAIQGGIILGAITLNVLGRSREKNATHSHALPS
jgi:rhamnose transport system permease protein